MFIMAICTLAAAIAMPFAMSPSNASLPAPSSAPAAPATNPVHFTDIAGQSHVLPATRPVAATVLLFMMHDCPISNAYVPEINRIAAEFAPRGVRLFCILVEPDLTLDAARAHAHDFALASPVVIDRDLALSQFAGATISPEAAVFDAAGERIYLGRIDDRYSIRGKPRDHATTRELRSALESILAGKTPSPAQTIAVGCYLPQPRSAVAP